MAKTDLERLESKVIRELRKENAKLRREIQQLRKKNFQIENMARLEDEDEIEVVETYKHVDKCPKCDSEKVYILTLRGLLYFKCHDCERQGRYNSRK